MSCEAKHFLGYITFSIFSLFLDFYLPYLLGAKTYWLVCWTQSPFYSLPPFLFFSVVLLHPLYLWCLLPCVKWHQSTLLWKQHSKAHRERNKGCRRREESISTPHRAAVRHRLPLWGKLWGCLSLHPIWCQDYHSPLSLYKLQNCLCPAFLSVIGQGSH